MGADQEIRNNPLAILFRAFRPLSGCGLYASSTLSFLPTADAALSRVDSVTERLAGSSRRSSAGRLVFMRLAISDLVSLQRFISWAIWKAITRLAAVASDALQEMLLPEEVIEVAADVFFLHLRYSSRRSARRCRAVLRSSRGVFCAFLTKPCSKTIMPSPTVKRTRAMPWADMRTDLPQARLQLPDQRHSQGPAVLRGLDVLTDRSSVFPLQVLEPLAHRLVAGPSAVEDHTQNWLLGFWVSSHTRSVPQMVRQSAEP